MSKKSGQGKGRIFGWIVLALLVLIAVGIIFLRGAVGKVDGQTPVKTESREETDPVATQPPEAELPDDAAQPAAPEASSVPADTAIQAETQQTTAPVPPAYEPPVFRPERGYEPGPVG